MELEMKKQPEIIFKGPIEYLDQSRLCISITRLFIGW